MLYIISNNNTKHNVITKKENFMIILDYPLCWKEIPISKRVLFFVMENILRDCLPVLVASLVIVGVGVVSARIAFASIAIIAAKKKFFSEI